MKTERIDRKVKQSIKYPCLMESRYTDYVVLFIREKEGIVVYDPSPGCSFFGHHVNYNVMDGFQPYSGTIKLSND